MALTKLKNSTKKVLIDDEDLSKILSKNWFLSPRGISSSDGNKKTISLSRFIMDCPKNMQIDHINHNIFDNRKGNLRIASFSQNMMNRRKPKNNTSGYKGVVWFNPVKKWQVCITAYGKKYFIGYFQNIKEAAKAYDLKAIELHGAFAFTNFK